MDRIIISNDVYSITLPLSKKPMIGSEEVSHKVEMASGKIVKEIIGFRTVIDTEYDAIPATSLTKVIKMVRAGGFLNVQYPDLDGTDKSELFDVTVSQMGIFKFHNGSPWWRGLILHMQSQEVS